MKRFSVLIALLLLVGMTTTHAQKTVPSVSVKTLEGESVELMDYVRQQPLTIVSFWATWCSPCKKELDTYADLYDDWKEIFGVEILAITIDNQRAFPKVAPMVSAKQWPFVVLSDVNQQLKNALNFQTIPQTFLINQKGEVLYEHSGYIPGAELELEEKMEQAGR